MNTFPAPDTKPRSTGQDVAAPTPVGAAGDTARITEDAGNPLCRVERAPSGRFAVVQGAITLGELCCEATALTYAAAVNNGPVRMTGVPRWSGANDQGPGPKTQGPEMENAA